MNKQHAQDEAVRYMKGAMDYLEKAVLFVRAGRPIADVRFCYTRVRECISDSQEYLRELKKLEGKK